MSTEDLYLITAATGKTGANAVRELRQEEVDSIRETAEGYVQRGRRFKAELQPQEMPPGAR